MGCRLWGCTESDTTEATQQQQQLQQGILGVVILKVFMHTNIEETWGGYPKIIKEELENGRRQVFKSINVEAPGNFPEAN